ncbi:MAG TPA: hypothetical protein VKU61_09690 [Candidatus Binatia bacterium]|nr:hypothetical protein [Candidatus Binatia bacterium]
MTTPKRRSTRRGSRGGRARPTPAAVPAEPSSETALDTFLEPTAPVAPPPDLPRTASPERDYAARVPPPAPERPRPTIRRAIFFDVENSSRSDHVARVLAHLGIDRMTRATDLVAVGNWRVINHETARMLAERGAHLVHSAPSVGVRDWSDLRIAVTAGVWLAAARPGDVVEIISDDQAFDAVGDVATSLGVEFRRLSYRGLAGVVGEIPDEPPAKDPNARRRRRSGRGGRGRRREQRAPAPVAAASTNGGGPEAEPHTAPHEELLAVARELIERAPEGTVSIDALSNALKAHGFRRTPGSPRLITRLRRIKELDVGRTGAIRLAAGAHVASSEVAAEPMSSMPVEPSDAAPDAVENGAAAATPPRRRRRRGGRRRRGRGGQAATATT